MSDWMSAQPNAYGFDGLFFIPIWKTEVNSLELTAFTAHF